MPLIAGGVFSPQNQKGKRALTHLLNATRARLSDQIVFLDDSELLLIAGKESNESIAEIVVQLSGTQSVIAGRVFSKSGVPLEIDEAMAERIKQTKGKWLGDNCWGRYIFIDLNKDKKVVTILRDPQGILTLFYFKYADGFLLSSDVSLLYDAVDEKPALNWMYLSSFVVNAHNITSATPFENVYEVEPACRTELSLTNGVSIQQFWDPTEIKSSFIHDERAFQDALYETLTSVTRAWTKGAEGICVELSGGLDSSSVLAVLKDVMPAQTPLTAVNLLHPEIASSNEIDYAQNAADSCDVPLKVLTLGSKPLFPEQNFLGRISRPTTFMLDSELGKELVALAGLGIQAEFMSGQGGDHLFLASPYIDSVADYILQKGLGGVFGTLSELSAHHRMPYLRVLAKTVQSLTSYTLGTMNHLELSLGHEKWMTKSFQDRIDLAIYRPIFWEKLKKVSPAKAQHILAIYSATLYIDRGYRMAARPIINPLLSQPLVELALSMPTYQSFAQGHNRVHFRRAIDKYKKGNYIWRKSKGETSGVMVLAMRAQFDYICELVLEGRFAQEKLIDRDALFETLNAFRHGKTDKLWPVVNLIVAETWLKSWNL